MRPAGALSILQDRALILKVKYISIYRKRLGKETFKTNICNTSQNMNLFN